VVRRAPLARLAGTQSHWTAPTADRVSSWPAPAPASVSSLAGLHHDKKGHARSLVGGAPDDRTRSSVSKVAAQRDDDPVAARAHRKRTVTPSDVKARVAAIDDAATCRVRHANPLAFRAFDRPTLLRRRFARPGGPSFLSRGTPERELLDRLASPKVLSGEVGDDRRRVFEMLTSVAKEPQHLPGFWGEEPALDALRLRGLGGTGATGAVGATGAAQMPWDGFLEWAGRAVLADTARLPEDALPAAVAAMAASAGWRRALEACSSRVPDGPLGARSSGALASLTMRAAFDGVLLPGAVRWLIPGGDATSSDADEAWQAAAWRPALLALRAFREHGNDAGIVHLTAALVAGHFRWGLRTAARRQKIDVAVPRWGAPPLSATAQETLRGAALWLSDADPWSQSVPWPREWGGPDGPWLATWLTRLLRGRSDLALLVLLDDRLCLAVAWGLLGRAQSALAQLDGWKTAPVFAEAREAVRQGLPGWPELGLPPERPRGPELDDLFRTLASTPDPSVALGSPHWMLPGGRGAHTNRLLKHGRRDEARRLRTILDRPDVRQKLEPLWILTGPEDTASVVALARWLAGRVPSPSESEWIAFLEWQCRQTQSATR
jgi:hypothetical protein